MSSTVPARSPILQVSPTTMAFIGQDGDAAQQIFKSLLRAQADRQTADAQPRECRGDVYVEPAQNNQADRDQKSAHPGRGASTKSTSVRKSPRPD